MACQTCEGDRRPRVGWHVRRWFLWEFDCLLISAVIHYTRSVYLLVLIIKIISPSIYSLCLLPSTQVQTNILRLFKTSILLHVTLYKLPHCCCRIFDLCVIFMINLNEYFITGGTSIIQYSVLPDKRHIITQDTANEVVLWDVLKVSTLFCLKCWIIIISNKFSPRQDRSIISEFVISIMRSKNARLWFIFPVGSVWTWNWG